jgi:hypothetical protein
MSRLILRSIFSSISTRHPAETFFKVPVYVKTIRQVEIKIQYFRSVEPINCKAFYTTRFKALSYYIPIAAFVKIETLFYVKDFRASFLPRKFANFL